MGQKIKKQLTIDEWICHYLADDSKYKDTERFLGRLLDICDKIVVKYNSPMYNKLWSICRNSAKWKPSKQRVAKFFINGFIKNQKKVEWIDNCSPVPTEYLEFIHTKDHYLVETALSTQTRMLITSDSTLYDTLHKLEAQLSIRTYMAEDFIKRYPNGFK